MNKSNWLHALLALAIMLLITLATRGNWWAGAAAGSWFYIGREHCQYEIRKQRGEPTWTKDAILDLVFPLVATITLAMLGPSLEVALIAIRY